MKDNLKLETVAAFNFVAQAEVIRSVLEDGGFEAYITNPMVGVYVGLASSVLVQVEASQAEAARKFLAENVKCEISEE